MASSRPPVRFTGVHGTFSREAPWVTPESDLMRLFAQVNVTPLFPKDPFVWSGQVDGWQVWRRLRLGLGSRGGDCVDWDVGGSSLRWRLQHEAYFDRGLLVHSHGLWPAIQAMKQGLQVPWMISVGSPVREDMTADIKLALANLGAWLHIYDPHVDWWGTLGSFGDGKVNWKRAQRFAGPPPHGTSPVYTSLRPRQGGNDAIVGISHSGVLNDPTKFRYWQDRKWLDFMAPTGVTV